MTLRERIADWISGGALTQARYEADFNLRQCCIWVDEFDRADDALLAIAAATRNGKSGTARKVHRMATEALK